MSNPSAGNKAAASACKFQSLAAPNPTSPALSSPQQFFADSPAGRRAGSASGQRSSPAPRSNQNSKPKHKQGKRVRAVDEDAAAELFSMQNPHGRRGQQSITHLMQFALPPRPNAHDRLHRHSHNASRRQPGHNPSWGMGSGYHAADKARYIHANYRFIVDPRGDYAAQAADADVHLDWNNVLQIIASGKTQNASCPICLAEPTAPRMAKCGHMFCTSCLIRYMHSEDASHPPPEKRPRWKKCPICWDSIYVSEMRPVRWYDGQENDPPREGGDFVLRLVKRKPGSTLAMPREGGEVVSKGEAIPWYFAAEVMDYARVMKGSEEYMMQQYDEAIAAIQRMEKEDELMFGEDAEWTGRAIRMLRESKDKVTGIGNPLSRLPKPDPPAEPERQPIEFNASDEGVPDMYLQKQGTTASSAAPVEASEARDRQPSSSLDVPRTIHDVRRRQAEKPQPNEYLFYQGLLHYYLSPLDIRILKAAFGTYDAFPSSILPRVERVSSGHVVDDELRKRVKYLGHLPYGCEVGFLECDWRDVVSAQVLEEFRPLLDQRRRRHDEKKAREEKERIRIEKASERELAHVRQRRRASITEHDAFFAPSLPPTIPEGGAVAIPGSPPFPNTAGRPGFASLASPSTSPGVNRTVWGTSAVAAADSDSSALPAHDPIRQQGDGWLHGWETDLQGGPEQHALTESMQGLDVTVQTPAAGGGKRGKKKQKITLMSTANARRGF